MNNHSKRKIIKSRVSTTRIKGSRFNPSDLSNSLNPLTGQEGQYAQLQSIRSSGLSVNSEKRTSNQPQDSRLPRFSRGETRGEKRRNNSPVEHRQAQRPKQEGSKQETLPISHPELMVTEPGPDVLYGSSKAVTVENNTGLVSKNKTKVKSTKTNQSLAKSTNLVSSSTSLTIENEFEFPRSTNTTTSLAKNAAVYPRLVTKNIPNESAAKSNTNFKSNSHKPISKSSSAYVPPSISKAASFKSKTITNSKAGTNLNNPLASNKDIPGSKRLNELALNILPNPNSQTGSVKGSNNFNRNQTLSTSVLDSHSNTTCFTSGPNIDQLNVQLADLRKKLEVEIVKNTETNDELVAIQLEKLEADEQIKTLHDTVKKGDDRISFLEQILNEDEKKITQLEQALKNCDQQIIQLEQKLKNYDQQVIELEQNLKNREILIAQVQKELTGREETINALAQQLNDRDQNINLLTQVVNKRDQTIDGLSSELQDKNTMIGQYTAKLREQEELRRKLHNEIQDIRGNIRVFCRVRPCLDAESAECADLKFPPDDDKKLVLTRHRNNYLGIDIPIRKTFIFEKVFPPQFTQEQIYSELQYIVQSAVDGYNVCIFAYGQTGSGKTYTMEGIANGPPETEGVIPRAIRQIFQITQELKYQNWEYELIGQSLEIYKEEIRDLLVNANGIGIPTLPTDENISGKDLEIEFDDIARTTRIPGLVSVAIDSLKRANQIIKIASANRAVSATACNERSSRSHSIFMVTIKGFNKDTGEVRTALLNLVDLAGCERISKSGSKGLQLDEAKMINKSLSALRTVIEGMAKKDSHIKFRDSKLTRLLQHSLDGQSKTLMILSVSPMKSDSDESHSALEFAEIASSAHIGQARRNTRASSKA
ncbi:hypothetical protein G9A89_007569 [Geosiphon pyriformis]|nr:hypothetical protein G9A89_007569 [Geosiphon pyriformis]